MKSIYWRGIEIKYIAQILGIDKYKGVDEDQDLVIEIEDVTRSNGSVSIYFESKFLGRYVVSGSSIELAFKRIEDILDKYSNAISWMNNWKGKNSL
jgi:hypothetical protein